MFELSDQFKFIVLGLILTKETQIAFMDDIYRIKTALFHTDPETLLLELKNINEKYGEIFTKNMARDPQGFSDYLDQFSLWLETVETIEITFAFKPRNEFLLKIHKWISRNLSKFCVLKVNFEPSIVGGLIVAAGGKYHNMSLSMMLDNYFVQNKDAILQKLQK